MRHCLDKAFSGQSRASWVSVFGKNLIHVERNAEKDAGDLKLAYKRKPNQPSLFEKKKVYKGI